MVARQSPISGMKSQAHLKYMMLAKLFSELERWNTSDSPSITGHMIEPIPDGHPLAVTFWATDELWKNACGSSTMPLEIKRTYRALVASANSEDEDEANDAEQHLHELLTEYGNFVGYDEWKKAFSAEKGIDVGLLFPASSR